MKLLFSILSFLLLFNVKGQTSLECRKLPEIANFLFPGKKNLGFSTSEKKYMGLCIINYDKDSLEYKQLASWDDFGWLGTMAFTDKGDIFIVPTPSVNVLYNPKLNQNILLKLDSKSGELASFYKFSSPLDFDVKNAFGLSSVVYDCTNKQIYVSSLYESTYKEEKGKIYSLDLTSKFIKDSLDNFDALGMGSVIMNNERSLLLGNARDGGVYKVLIDQEGKFLNKPELLFTLEQLGLPTDDIPRKFKILQNGAIQITATPFYFNLIAPHERKDSNYVVIFDKVMKKWIRVG